MLSFLCVICVLSISFCIHLARLPQDDTESFQEQRKDGLESRQKIFRFDERDFFVPAWIKFSVLDTNIG